MVAKYNREFKLNPKDIELIENALLKYQRDNFLEKGTADPTIIELLAKIYHQKVWYRPSENFVSG